jgi:hypothetical protein
MMLVRLKNNSLLFFAVVITAALISQVIVSPIVSALTEKDLKSIYSETTFYDPDACDPNADTSATTNSSVFMLGDSILQSAEGGGLKEKLKKQGYTDITIDAVRSRSIISPGVGTTNGLEAVDTPAANKDKITKAGTIVIVLGTNYDGGFEANLKKLVDKIQGLNNTARLFWVNVGIKTQTVEMNKTNKIINKNQSKYKYTIVDWHKEVVGDPSLIGGDKVHPTADGAKKLVSLISEQLGKYTEGVGGAGSGGTAPIKGDQAEKNAAILWNYLIGKGLTDIQAAGVLANIKAESGFNPKLLNEVGAMGIVQWLGGRKQKLLRKANYWDFQVQVDFMWEELTGDYDYVLKHLKAAKTIEQAVWVMLTEYEIPCIKGPSWQNPGACGVQQNLRLRFAKDFLDKFGKYGAGTTTDACGGDQSGLGVSADGFVFPQKTTQKKLKNAGGNENWMTCISPIKQMAPGVRMDLCHHHYLAADIMNSTHTPVVAPRPGVIVYANESTQVGLMIKLYSDKKRGGDGYTYYFAHNLSGSSKVSAGQKVKAGDQLTEVGDTEDAEGTPPHTHMTISPDQGSCSQGASGASCTLIDPGPYLKASFKALPPQ